jgi:hypothetical protein
MLLAQNTAAIEQARLYQRMKPGPQPTVDANGNALPESTGTETDDSFGSQKILKAQERPTTFVVTGAASFVYTDNVALTRRGTRSDVFGIVDAGIAWSRRLGYNVEGSIGARVSIFRYDKADELDFENLGFGVGVAWSPPSLRGASLFVRYDLTELLDREGDQILADHNFTLGIQKNVALGRSHGFTVGAVGILGLSDPRSAERSQLGGFIGYHLDITRKLQTDILYRPAAHFYTDSGRADFNQIISWNVRYRFTDWAELNANASYGLNRSDRSVFDYEVLTTGASLALTVRF